MADNDTPVLNSKVPETSQETTRDLTKNTLENLEALVRERLNAAHKNTLENSYALNIQEPEAVKTINAEALETIRKKYQSPQENSIALTERTQENPQQGKTADDNLLPPSEIPIDRADAEKISRTAKPATRHDLPATVASRYLRIKDSYYLPDKTVAFEDRGNKLTLATENHTVIRDALAIAETRGWQRITVSGSQSFTYQVWREASLKGMDVSGYKPTDLEVAELSQAMALRDARKEVGEPPKTPGRKGTATTRRRHAWHIVSAWHRPLPARP